MFKFIPSHHQTTERLGGSQLVIGVMQKETLFNNPTADVAHPTCGVFVRLNRTYGHGRSSARCLYRIQSPKCVHGQQSEVQTTKTRNGYADWNLGTWPRNRPHLNLR
jgi:hypothetical protein